MTTTAVQRQQDQHRQLDSEPGWALGLLLRRRGPVPLVVLALLTLAGALGRDAEDKLVSGAYLDPPAESQRAAELLGGEFPVGRRIWCSSRRRAPARWTLRRPRRQGAS